MASVEKEQDSKIPIEEFKLKYGKGPYLSSCGTCNHHTYKRSYAPCSVILRECGVETTGIGTCKMYRPIANCQWAAWGKS